MGQRGNPAGMCDEMTITREQAEAALAAVRKRYAGYDDVNEIALIQDWGSRYGRVAWLITWESGPYEWAYRAAMGGINEEVATDLVTEFGTTPQKAGKLATEREIRFPAGVLGEPYDSFSLTLSEG